MAKKVEELKLWQRAEEMWTAVNAIIRKPVLARDPPLRSQLSDATDSVLSNLSEGFEQPTDRGFARYLYVVKASNAEARTRVLLAHKRGYISAPECDAARNLTDEVARMTTGLIKYLLKSDRRNRGQGTTD